MPKLLYFVACEKVIVAQDGPLSLIYVLEKVTMHVPAAAKLQGNVITPMRWAVVTVWERQQSDSGSYEQMIRMLGENGEIIVYTETRQLDFAGKRLARLIAENMQFPVTDSTLTIELLMRPVGVSEWASIATYPIEVETIRV